MPYRKLEPGQTRFKGTQVFLGPKRPKPPTGTSPALAKPKAPPTSDLKLQPISPPPASPKASASPLRSDPAVIYGEAAEANRSKVESEIMRSKLVFKNGKVTLAGPR
jgi:hypothetical protein